MEETKGQKSHFRAPSISDDTQRQSLLYKNVATEIGRTAHGWISKRADWAEVLYHGHV
jgi:hypothetical protein